MLMYTHVTGVQLLGAVTLVINSHIVLFAHKMFGKRKQMVFMSDIPRRKLIPRIICSHRAALDIDPNVESRKRRRVDPEDEDQSDNWLERYLLKKPIVTDVGEIPEEPYEIFECLPIDWCVIDVHDNDQASIPNMSGSRWSSFHHLVPA